MAASVAFVLADGMSTDALHRVLTGEWGCSCAGATEVEHVYYDTFDGRLARAGLVLQHERAAPSERAASGWLGLRGLGELEPPGQSAVAEVPTDPRQVADARLRDRLVEVSEGRALFPIVVVKARVRNYRVLGPEAKTTVRLVVNSPRAYASVPRPPAVPAARSDDSPSAVAPPERPLPSTITVVPVRGYGADLERVVARLRPLTGPEPALDPLQRAARALGIRLGADPSDTRVPLVADAPAAAAAAALLERLVAVMAVNEAGARSRLDIEFLHDFRVAVRRARTIVRSAKGVLPRTAREALGAELKWLGDMTTPVRDLDVYLEHAPPEPALEPLWAVLEARHRAAQAALVAALDSERYQGFQAIAASVTRPRSVPVRGTTTGRWAAKSVSSAHRRLLDLGRGAVEAAELHEVRKAGKRLRYLLDAFSPVLGAEATDAFIGDLKALQNVLGDLQDSTVHAEMLTRVGAELQGAAPATLIAIGRLLEVEHRRQRKAVAGFAERFERFAAERGDVEAALARLERP